MQETDGTNSHWQRITPITPWQSLTTPSLNTRCLSQALQSLVVQEHTEHRPTATPHHPATPTWAWLVLGQLCLLKRGFTVCGQLIITYVAHNICEMVHIWSHNNLLSLNTRVIHEPRLSKGGRKGLYKQSPGQHKEWELCNTLLSGTCVSRYSSPICYNLTLKFNKHHIVCGLKFTDKLT